jgi:hypothetical protein
MANDVKIVITAQNKTKKALSSVNRGLAGLKRAAFSAKSAVAAVAGALGIGLLIRNSFKAIDALAKTSAKLGIATEALVGLRHAAERTGVASNTLDMALQRMTRRIAEAAQGTGEAKSALKELGLDAQALAAMSPDQAFTAITAAMEGVTRQSDKVRLAFKLFDSEGVNLVNTMALGESGLSAMALEAQELGLIISNVDARKIEAAGDAFSNVGKATEGIANQVSIGLAPAVEGLSKLFIQNTKDMIGFGTMSDAVLSGVKDAVVILGDTWWTLRFVYLELKKQVLNMVASWLGVLAKADTALTNFINKIPGMSAETSTALQSAADNAQSLYANASIAATEYWASSLTGSVTLLNSINEVIAKNKELANAPIKTESTTKVAINGVKSFNSQMDAMAEKLSDVDTQAAGFIDRFSTGLSTQLTQALMTGKFAFKEFALSIIADLTAMILKAIIFTQIKLALNAIGFGGLLGGASGGNVTAVKGKASGGGLNRGRPFMVGEQGRELFVPKTDGQLVPNHKLGGGDPLTVNFNINAIDTQTGTGFLIKNKQSIVGMIDQAYRKQGRQGVMA